MRNCIVNFNAIFNTTFGQDLFILGNHPELGQWNFARGLKMITDKQSYPKWKSQRKIHVDQGYELEFKICIFQDKKFKAWQNFPPNLNRKFRLDCRGITLLIIQNVQALIEEKRFDNFLSNQLLPIQVKKYTSMVKEELSSEEESFDQNESDIDNSIQSSVTQEIDQHNIKSLISSFRYILSEGQLKLKSWITQSFNINNINPQNLNLLNKNTTYILNSLNHVQLQIKVKNSNSLIFTVPLYNYKEWSKTINKICKQLQQIISSNPSFLNPAIILYGIQFCLIPKILKTYFNQLDQHRFLLHINNFDFLNHTSNLTNSQIIESILKADFLTFENYSVFDEFKHYIQKEGVQLHIKCVNTNQYVLSINQKIIFCKIQNYLEGIELKKNIQILDLKTRSKNLLLQEISQVYENCKNKKIFFLNFGKYQNLDLLLRNKQILLKLSNEILIYVFTPNKLKFFEDIVQIFPKIVFISYTYLQIGYDRQIFYLLSVPETQIYLSDLIDEINEQISNFPNIKVTIQKNIIYIKLFEDNAVSYENFDNIYSLILQLVNSFNQITHQKLLIHRINRSVIQIKQIYQSQIFLTNLIFKNSQIPIDFLFLITIDKFQNFSYHYHLKNMIQQKNSYYFDNTKFYSYALEIDRSIHQINPIKYSDINKFFNLIFKSHSQVYYNKLKISNAKLMEQFNFNCDDNN